MIKHFRIGDVVKTVDCDPGPWRSKVTPNVEHIIAEVTVSQKRIQYATNRGAWYYHSDFELVREADEESWAKAVEGT